jgi:hypothetical protein
MWLPLAQKQYESVRSRTNSPSIHSHQNAINMVRGASGKGDGDKLLLYGEKAQNIVVTYKASPAPSERQPKNGNRESAPSKRTRKTFLHSASGLRRPLPNPDATKRADQLLRYAKLFPDSRYALAAMGVAATSFHGTKPPQDAGSR